MQFIKVDCCHLIGAIFASKGLHMVSAVHPKLQKGELLRLVASKGLHMVSAVHPACSKPAGGMNVLQRGCTWLVQFIFRFSIVGSDNVACFKGAAHG